ncbi:MAG TPA: nuclear transport factor 2 family protein [Thermoanaerobaculia bacterium]|nr:nuclear transport factor 2 family protein [Thermoanaerobaculia bacterium]
MIAALQLLATAAAGVALFRLWRAALPPQLWLQRVVAAGFLVRAVAGQVLFWISWARLPILPQLQAGNGLWFFGADALGYFANASAASSEGLAAIALMPPQPALVYVQLLALAAWLFGAVTATGLLLNLFCYLGCVALLRRWMHAHEGAALAIIAISVSPSFVLWSLQPLKDTLFQLLVVAFVCTCAAWQRTWTWRLGALLVLVLAALSGVRWYVAFALLIVAVPFLFATARKGLALGAAAVVALLLSRALLVGGRGQVPQPVVALLTPSTTFAAIAELPSLIGGARDAFDAMGGRTVIQSPPWPRTTRPLAPPAGSDETQIRAVVARIADGWNRGDAEAVLAHFDDAPDVEIWNDGKRTAAGSEEVRAAYGAATGEETVTITDVRVLIDGGTATASGRWQRESRAGSVTFVLRRSGGRWRVVRQTTLASPTEADRRRPRRLSVRASRPHSGGETPPQTAGGTPAVRFRWSRFATGAAAMVLPRAVGESLGLFHIGGGRGFLWLTDVDTLILDLALIAAIFVIATHFRAARRDPLFWMLVALTLLIGVPLAYSVMNFGTLFRLRETVYLGVILAPAAAIAAAARRAPADP